MMQHLLRRLVFDVPLLNEHTKMPLKVRLRRFSTHHSVGSFPVAASKDVHLPCAKKHGDPLLSQLKQHDKDIIINSSSFKCIH